MNISDSPKSVSGIFDIDMKNFDLEKVRGNIEMQNLLYTSEGKPDYRIDGVFLKVDTLEDGGQHILLESEVLSAEVTGSKAVKKIPVVLQDYLWRTYPSFMPLLSKKSYQHSQDSILADYRIDMEKIEGRINRTTEKDQLDLLNKCLLHLEKEQPLCSIECNQMESEILKELSPHSYKPIIQIEGEHDINQVIKLVLQKTKNMFFYTSYESDSKRV